VSGVTSVTPSAALAANDILLASYFISVPAGLTYVRMETPSPATNGSATVFTLAAAPVAGTATVFLNGVTQEAGNDYTLSGVTITYMAAPAATDKLRVSYASAVPTGVSQTGLVPPTPPVDGFTRMFAFTGQSGTETVVLNGVTLCPGPGNEYEITGSVITLALPPPASALLLVDAWVGFPVATATLSKSFVDSVNGQVIGRNLVGVVNEYGRDAIGSVTSLRDSLGSLSSVYRYKPYGQMIHNSANATPWAFQFVGSAGYDALSLLFATISAGRRIYDYETGRWITKDRQSHERMAKIQAEVERINEINRQNRERQMNPNMPNHQPNPFAPSQPGFPPAPGGPHQPGRFYMAGLGRWLTQARLDMILEEGEPPYAYAFNNPVTYVDPTGNYPISPTALMALSKGKHTIDKKTNCWKNEYTDYSQNTTVNFFHVQGLFAGKLKGCVQCPPKCPNPPKDPVATMATAFACIALAESSFDTHNHSSGNNLGLMSLDPSHFSACTSSTPICNDANQVGASVHLMAKFCNSTFYHAIHRYWGTVQGQTSDFSNCIATYGVTVEDLKAIPCSCIQCTPCSGSWS